MQLYRSGNVNLFRYLTVWDMYKAVYWWWMNHSIFLMTMASDSTINWDYNLFYLVIIYGFGEMLSHFVRASGRVPSQVVVALIVLY